MTDHSQINFTALTYYITPAHPCGYLEGQQATSLFLNPSISPSPSLYSHLANHGFRRSGRHLYRPQCQNCNACIPIRVPVDHFSPSRSQQRIWQRNSDLVVTIKPAGFDPVHFQLYTDYLKTRHKDGGMDNPQPENYLSFLSCDGIDTRFYEFCLDSRVIAIAVADILGNGMSAVYTFFDPDFSRRSLGTYAILWEIDQAKRLGLPWLYLGYWIRECRKMSYKNQFHPFQSYRDGQWIQSGSGETC